jgi:hypothetical protein
MQLNIKDAASFVKVARSTIYAKIKSGELSKTADNKIDTSELLRVFGEPERQVDNTRLDSLSDPENTLKIQVTSLQKQVTMLEKSLDEATGREQWLQNQMENTVKLIAMVHQDLPTPIPSEKTPLLLLLVIIFSVLAIGLAVILGMIYLKNGSF